MGIPGPEHNSSEYVEWQTSSPRSRNCFEPIEPVTVKISQDTSSDTVATDVRDPATELLGKFDSQKLTSSPPPTWPSVTPIRAQKQFSDYTELTGSKMGVRMYSPGYLKRSQSRFERQERKCPRIQDDSWCSSRPYKTVYDTSSSPLGAEIDERTFLGNVLRPLRSSELNTLDGSPSHSSKILSAPPALVRASPEILVEDSDDDVDWDSLPAAPDPNEEISVDQKYLVQIEDAVRNVHTDTAPEPDEECRVAEEASNVEQAQNEPDYHQEVLENSRLTVAFSHPTLHRYIVSRIEYLQDRTLLHCRHTSGICMIALEQSWILTEIKKDEVIHVVGSYDISEHYVVVNHSKHLLIVSPDTLVSCTTIADAFKCDRQVILRNRLKSPSDSTKPLVYGSITHELIQICMLNNYSTLTGFKKTLKYLLNQKFLEELAVINVDVRTADKEISARLPEIIKWIRTYITERDEVSTRVYRSTKDVNLTISKIEQVEKEIWSPLYGLKGKIDVIATVKTGLESYTTAVEIKTGRNTQSISHRAQLMLYCLLLQERYAPAVPWALLYYSGSGDTIVVPPLQDEIRGLIQKRNLIAKYMDEPDTLPPVINDPFTCRSCARLPTCATYAAVENVEIEALALSEQFKEYSAHLCTEYKDFFAKWDRLVTLESSETTQQAKFLWCLSGEEREEVGQCFKAVCVSAAGDVVVDGIKTTYLYDITYTGGASFPENSRIGPGSPIIISHMNAIATAQGYVRAAQAGVFTIAVNQSLEEGITYRVDLDEYVQFMAIGRTNLTRIVSGNSRLLDLIATKKAPRFDRTLDVKIPSHFNEDQANAVEKVLKAQDYTLVLGMPGTGKTTVIVAIAEMLAAQGKSVLISGFTHSAVDNIVAKIMSGSGDVLRLGHPLKVHPDVHPVLAANREITCQEDWEQCYMTPKIVATTSLAMGNWLFTRRRFDYCIVDEASQLTLPVCLGPLRFADKFVLVGDHYQLSPLVRNKEAAKGGMGESLFKQLCDAHPQAVVQLSHQYRMCEDIMKLSSMLIYDNKLICADDCVAQQKLNLPVSVSVPAWLRPVIAPDNRVVFLNTDTLDAQETHRTDGKANYVEVDIVANVVKAFSKAGVDQRQIGVISVYRVQRHILREKLGAYPKIDVLTADQAQGRDKDCIVISLVRSNDQGVVGSLLRDWRRINVTFTRAKKKLVIVGSRETLKSSDTLEKFLHVIESQDWMWNAGATALESA